MAPSSNPFSCSSSNPEEEFQVAPDDEQYYKCYETVVAALPRDERWPPITGHMFAGFWFPESCLLRLLALRDVFEARPTDLLLVTFPKAGTTWLKALAFAITTRHRHPPSSHVHPLMTTPVHDCVLFFESPVGSFHENIHDYNAMPSPRLLASHLPCSLLPPSVLTNPDCCRIIYLCRNPKDALVSYWHFNKKFIVPVNRLEPISLDKAVELFCEGASPYGPFWDHALEYWHESRRRPEKVLFLKYEEMMAEPEKHVKTLAEFAGCPFSEEEERAGVVEEIARLCSFDKLSSKEANKVGILGRKAGEGVVTVKNETFFRKGKAGDWMNHLTPEMARRFDDITAEKLHGSGLTFT